MSIAAASIRARRQRDTARACGPHVAGRLFATSPKRLRFSRETAKNVNSHSTTDASRLIVPDPRWPGRSSFRLTDDSGTALLERHLATALPTFARIQQGSTSLGFSPESGKKDCY